MTLRARRALRTAAQRKRCSIFTDALRSHPRSAALLDAPRVILRVLCWNENASPPTPSPRAFKLRVTHLMPTTVLPYGAEPLPPLAPQPQPPPQQALSATPRQRPRSAAAAALPPVERMAPGRALRTYGGVLRGAMLQAATTRLEDEVAQMQSSLESAQQLAHSARGGEEQGRPQSAWMRRALASIG